MRTKFTTKGELKEPIKNMAQICMLFINLFRKQNLIDFKNTRRSEITINHRKLKETRKNIRMNSVRGSTGQIRIIKERLQSASTNWRRSTNYSKSAKSKGRENSYQQL